jgi:hypothetical protein
MNVDLKARWLAALRSGVYQQGHFVLKDEQNRYCCLGVALDLKDPCKWGALEGSEHSTRQGYNWANHPAALAGRPLSRELGLPDEAAGELAYMNDQQDFNFAMIADWIEINL